MSSIEKLEQDIHQLKLTRENDMKKVNEINRTITALQIGQLLLVVVLLFVLTNR